MEYEEVKTEVTKKEDLLVQPMVVKSIKTVDTDSGEANIVTAELLESKKEVNFFMSTDRSNESFIGKTYVLKTAVSKRNRNYFYLQEIKVKS